MRAWIQSFLLFRFTRIHLAFLLLTYVLLQAAFSSGVMLQRQFNIERAVLAVENRICLDLPRLPLPNLALNTAGNPPQVQAYLQKLNRALTDQALPLRVYSLQGISPVAASRSSGEQIQRSLQAPEQNLQLQLDLLPLRLWDQLSFYPCFLALALLVLIRPYLKFKPARTATNRQPCSLQLDLQHKKLLVAETGNSVPLANKPLCFYAALLHFCANNPQASLLQNKPLPESLLLMADKYFLYLVSLGHTIRKRPDFTANLEKMLSEIRSALDELLGEDSRSKAIYYPPKALGEGARSKLHNFALERLSEGRWAILGGEQCERELPA